LDPIRYHDLASLFQAIALSDRLRMSLLPEGSADDTFECDMLGVPIDRTNLVLRAVDTFRAATVSIFFLQKNIL
jgi:4-diphosphocytidyl-2C-methyl-D-erythritol kinase